MWASGPLVRSAPLGFDRPLDWYDLYGVEVHARTDGEHADGHLVGILLRGGSYTLPEHVGWLWADAIGADPGEGVAHPSLAYFVAMQGLGASILEVFEMLDAGADSGVLMGEVELELMRHSLRAQPTSARRRSRGSTAGEARGRAFLTGCSSSSP